MSYPMGVTSNDPEFDMPSVEDNDCNHCGECEDCDRREKRAALAEDTFARIERSLR